MAFFTRWRVFVAISVLVIVLISSHIFLYISRALHFWDPPRVPCVWRHEVGPVPTIVVPHHLARWRNATQTKVRQETEEYLKSFLSSGQHESVCNAGSTLGFGAKREPYHQPHFAGQFFFYVSLMLWQNFIFDSQSCLRQFLVEEESVTFWGHYLEDKPTWSVQMLNALKPSFGDHFLASTGCAASKHNVPAISIPKGHDWFIHPSDAYWLGSTIIREKDPGADSQGKSASLIAKTKLQFTVLQRAWARKILNPDEIEHTLQGYAKSADNAKGISFNFTSVNFENTQLPAQVDRMRTTDVMITVHGAGVTNVAFLKPCAIAIEVMPFGLGIPPNSHYFGALARSADVLHYSWIAQKQHSNLIPEPKLSGGKDCRPIYNPLPDDIEAAHKKCYEDKYCRACCKLTAITVDTGILQDVLKKALVDRETCLRTHPLYQ
jgi:Glycosyltransferase 61